MWYVYIALTRTEKFYTGISSNPEKRILDHNSGKGSKFASIQGPLKLLYISPSFSDKSKARKREVQVKDWSREKKIKLIRGTWA